MGRNNNIRQNNNRRRSIGVWHRYIGVSAAFFLALLSITGLLLNHGDSLDLEHRFIRSKLLLDWYGIAAPEESISFAAGSHVITQLGKRLYYEDRPLEGKYGHLTGTVATDDALLVAAGKSALLLTPDGELIERIDEGDDLPLGIIAVGLDAVARPVIRTATGIYQPDRNWLRWVRSEPATDVNWARPVAISTDLGERIRRHYLGNSLSVERVLLDIHSGRILKGAGTAVADAIAILMLILTTTGVWTWLRRRRRERGN